MWHIPGTVLSLSLDGRINGASKSRLERPPFNFVSIISGGFPMSFRSFLEHHISWNMPRDWSGDQSCVSFQVFCDNTTALFPINCESYKILVCPIIPRKVTCFFRPDAFTCLCSS